LCRDDVVSGYFALLECGHSVCAECAQQAIKFADGPNLKCPTCRAPTPKQRIDMIMMSSSNATGETGVAAIEQMAVLGDHSAKVKCLFKV
jgi:hypothetical protein